ncbi:MAG: nucleotidyltransferase family protein [Clostridiaceae bacterium]
MNVTAIILAAGLARRMNGDKLHLKLNGNEIIDTVLSTVSSVDFKKTIVVTNDPVIAARANLLNLTPVANLDAPTGQSTSIIKGVLASKNDTSGYLFIMGDQPLLSKDTLGIILQAFEESPSSIILPMYGEKPGSPVLFPSSLKSELLSLEGDLGGKVVMKNHPELIIKVPISSQQELFDIDTKEDYEAIKKIVQD